METVKVFWREKFNGKAVTINAADFDSAIHRRESDGPWGAGVGAGQDASEVNTDPPKEEGGSPLKTRGRPKKTEE